MGVKLASHFFADPEEVNTLLPGGCNIKDHAIVDMKETISRMEKRFNQSQKLPIRNLMKSFNELKNRFVSDFPNESEHLLCTGGALMLIQEVDKITD